MPTRYNARSISLPSRSHPSTAKIEEQLRKLKTWESSSSISSSASVCSALSGLQDLYDSIDDLLCMRSTQQVLSRSQNKQLVDELLDGSMKLLDICGIARDMTLETQEHAAALHSAVRRRKGDSAIRASVSAYICFRKKMKKDAKNLITSMIKMEETFNSSPLVNPDQHLSSVIGALRRVCLANSSIFESLLVYLTPLTKPKARGWSVLSKWVHRGAIACEENRNMNEFESVDAALCSLGEGADGEKIQLAQRRLESLEITAKDIETGLDSVFRRLIKTRASLLNIISQ